VADLSLLGTVYYASPARMPLFSGLDNTLNGNALGAGVFVNPLGTPGIGTGASPLTNTSGQVVGYLANDPSAQFVGGGIGTFSTVRQVVSLGDTRNLDMSVVKRFTAPDSMKIEFRADWYNLFNHPQFTGLPISTLGFGLQSPDFLVVGNPQFANFRNAVSSNPRTVQLALRLIF
jgi:hypothetical protein